MFAVIFMVQPRLWDVRSPGGALILSGGQWSTACRSRRCGSSRKRNSRASGGSVVDQQRTTAPSGRHTNSGSLAMLAAMRRLRSLPLSARHWFEKIVAGWVIPARSWRARTSSPLDVPALPRNRRTRARGRSGPSRFQRDLTRLNLCVVPDAGTRRSAPRVMAALAGVIHDRQGATRNDHKCGQRDQ